MILKPAIRSFFARRHDGSFFFLDKKETKNQGCIKSAKIKS